MRRRFFLAPDKATISSHADGHSQGSCHPGEPTLEQGKDMRRRKAQRDTSGFGLRPPGLPALLRWWSLERTCDTDPGERRGSVFKLYIYNFCLLVPASAIKYLF